jgi:hypothetical protein
VLTESLIGESGRLPAWRALRSTSELYIRYEDDPFTTTPDAGFQEYYDLTNDPGEHRNLLGTNGRHDPGEPSPGALPALLDFYSTCTGQLGAPESGKFPCP